MRPAVRWEAPPFGTSALDAAILYRDGVAALIAGIPHADRLLAAAVACDPAFVLAHVGLGVSRFVATGIAYAPPAVAPAGRGERHHAEIVRAWLSGEQRRGVDLRREHLVEYPATCSSSGCRRSRPAPRVRRSCGARGTGSRASRAAPAPRT